jgi:hypothetical protein
MAYRLVARTLSVQENKNTNAPIGVPTHNHSVQVEGSLQALDKAMFGIAVRNVKVKDRDAFTQDVSIFCSAFHISVKFISRQQEDK